MRAGMWLEALAQRYEVDLLVVPVYGAGRPDADAFARQYCRSVTVVPREALTRALAAGMAEAGGPLDVLRAFEASIPACLEAVDTLDLDIDVIHAFRLYTTPVALALAARAPQARLHVDLDDIESVTRSRIAAMHRLNGRLDPARAEDAEAGRFAEAERDLLPRFQRLYVCSDLDAARLRELLPGLTAEVRVVPNAVRLPVPPPSPRTTHPFTFLFVGTMGYAPNLDAVRWFTRRIWPRVHARAGRPVLFRVVGPPPETDLSAVARLPGVRVAGPVPDVTPEYGDADAVVVPLRAGGGTRIKALEAFAHGRPVVSTTIGVEGIEATPGRDLLVADDPDAFADACLRLIDDPALGAAIATSAARLVTLRYSQDIVAPLIGGPA
ncbi:MAG: glycosyltransferase [Dehalococcoidia bacterium]